MCTYRVCVIRYMVHVIRYMEHVIHTHARIQSYTLYKHARTHARTYARTHARIHARIYNVMDHNKLYKWLDFFSESYTITRNDHEI